MGVSLDIKYVYCELTYLQHIEKRLTQQFKKHIHLHSQYYCSCSGFGAFLNRYQRNRTIQIPLDYYLRTWRIIFVLLSYNNQRAISSWRSETTLKRIQNAAKWISQARKGAKRAPKVYSELEYSRLV
jgi:hypothetical protein